MGDISGGVASAYMETKEKLLLPVLLFLEGVNLPLRHFL